jgi:hypothetical protein
MRACQIACLALFALAGVSRAETASPDPEAAHKARMEKSLQCSRQADAKSLTGAPRKDFMRACLKG